jgi:hypothetical protein
MSASHAANVELRRQIGPYSRSLRKGIIDGRSREGRFLAAYAADLECDLGGKGAMTTIQHRLVERASMLGLHVLLFDEKAVKEGGLSPRDSREYLSLHGALTRTLAQIDATKQKGGNGKPKPESLTDIVAAHDGEPPS